MKSSAEFECDCVDLQGEKVKTRFDFRMPEFLAPILHDVKCRGCAAIWTVKFRKIVGGQTNFTFRLKTPSVKLGEYLKKKKIEAILNEPQKKSPIFVVPGFRKA